MLHHAHAQGHVFAEESIGHIQPQPPLQVQAPQAQDAATANGVSSPEGNKAIAKAMNSASTPKVLSPLSSMLQTPHMSGNSMPVLQQMGPTCTVQQQQSVLMKQIMGRNQAQQEEIQQVTGQLKALGWSSRARCSWMQLVAMAASQWRCWWSSRRVTDREARPTSIASVPCVCVCACACALCAALYCTVSVTIEGLVYGHVMMDWIAAKPI